MRAADFFDVWPNSLLRLGLARGTSFGWHFFWVEQGPVAVLPLAAPVHLEFHAVFSPEE